MKRVYIVFSTDGVGGTEKRFFDVWHELRNQGLDIHFVLSLAALESLSKQGNAQEIIDLQSDFTHVIYPACDKENANLDAAKYVEQSRFKNHYQFCFAVNKFFAQQAKGAIVHYPTAYVPFAQILNRHRLVVSWVAAVKPLAKFSSFKNVVMVWLSLIFASRVDVLNPNNLIYLNKKLPWGNKFSLTAGGTHINPQRYNVLPKKNIFAFLGRLEPVKQGLRLMQMLPAIDNALQAKGYSNYKFAFYGDGSQRSDMEKLANSTSHKNLDIKIEYAHNPEIALGEADIYFSLQLDSNYPSRALAEAMACGAYPIITQNGETAEMLGNMPHYAYVPEAFEAHHIVAALLKYLEKTEIEKIETAQSISRYAKERFVLSVQANYFKSLYASL